MERGSIVPQMRAVLKRAPATSARYSSLGVPPVHRGTCRKRGDRDSLKVDEDLGREDGETLPQCQERDWVESQQQEMAQTREHATYTARHDEPPEKQ